MFYESKEKSNQIGLLHDAGSGDFGALLFEFVDQQRLIEVIEKSISQQNNCKNQTSEN